VESAMTTRTEWGIEMNRAQRRLQPKLARHKQMQRINPAAALNLRWPGPV